MLANISWKSWTKHWNLTGTPGSCLLVLWNSTHFVVSSCGAPGEITLSFQQVLLHSFTPLYMFKEEGMCAGLCQFQPLKKKNLTYFPKLKLYFSKCGSSNLVCGITDWGMIRVRCATLRSQAELKTNLEPQAFGAGLSSTFPCSLQSLLTKLKLSLKLSGELKFVLQRNESFSYWVPPIKWQLLK